MYFVIVGVLLILLKTAELGPFANLSLWWILSPLPLAVVWWAWADSSGYTKRQEMEKLERKKRDRRLQAMDALGMDNKGRRGKSTSAKVARHRKTSS